MQSKTFERFCEQHYPRVRQYCYYRLSSCFNRDDAADQVTQEIFTRLASMPNFLEHPHPEALLFRIASTKVVNYFREEGYKSEVGTTNCDEIENELLPWESEREDLSTELDEHIRALPPKLRKVMVRRMRGSSPKQIASDLGLSPDAVYQRINRAIRKIRSRMLE